VYIWWGNQFPHLFYFLRMKRILFSLVLSICAIGCTTVDHSRYLEITGTIDPYFDGYNVYFRPQPFPTADVVDSCRIEKGKFSFLLEADSLYVGDVVLSFSSQRRVEPILVAVEPGKLEIELGLDSRSWGTPLNDTLANWKKFIEENVQQKRNQELMDAQRLFAKRTEQLVRSQPNALGGYLFLMYSSTFDADALKELDSLKYYQYIPDVTKRPIRFKKK